MAADWDQGGDVEDHGGLRGHLDSANRVSGKFPEGLRVLVVDEDPAYLLIMEEQLRNFNYEVTKCNIAKNALSLLQSNKGRFDIVIMDIQNSDVEVYKFLSQVGLQMNLPVIVMSVDHSVKSVMEVLKKGACDYLIKPVPSEVLRMIYKHVAKRSLEETAAAENSYSNDDETDVRNQNKRRNENDNHEDEYDNEHASTSKKRRVVWSTELRDKFVAAVNQIGVEKAVPKKILEIMNVPELTRENVASHLQKYRMHLKKQNDHREDINRSFISAQQVGSLYGNESVLSMTQSVQFPHHINLESGMNSPWPSSIPHFKQLVPSPSHRLMSDGISVAIAGRNGISHQRRTSEFSDLRNTEAGNAISTCNTEDAEMMGLMHNENYDMFDDLYQGIPMNWNVEDQGNSFPYTEPVLPLPISQDLSSLHNVQTEPMILPGIEAHSMSWSAAQTRPESELPNQHSAFFHQQENDALTRDGRFDLISGYSMNNKLI